MHPITTSTSPLRWLYFSLGWVFTVIGFVGLAVPLLPTTPFLILAAFLFSKSSPRWHAWLLGLRWLGPVIHDWEKGQVIRRSAKWAATLVLVPSVGGTCLFLSVHWLGKAILAIIAASTLTFLWTRPESLSQTS